MMCEQAGRTKSDEVRHVTEIRGVVALPPWLILLLVIGLSSLLAVTISSWMVTWYRMDRIQLQIDLLEDYTEGRIDHLPYRTGEINVEPTEEADDE